MRGAPTHAGTITFERHRFQYMRGYPSKEKL